MLAYLINLSETSSIVAKQWKVAIIHPVAKVPQPVTPSDFSPISFTPIISRLTERERERDRQTDRERHRERVREIVRRYLYPAFEDKATNNLLKDQYQHDFRPTGSTTPALVSILQQTTQVLEDNE